MRWIDITLPDPTMHQELDSRMAAAAALVAKIPPLQVQFGLDSPRVLAVMAEVGQELFQGIKAVDLGSFDTSRCPESNEIPALGQRGHDELVGYHIVTAEAWVGLPWIWLHNGLGFLYEKYPVCSSTRSSHLPHGQNQRPWMQRLTRARFLVGDQGGSSVRETLNQLRPVGVGRPEILFIPGHTDRERLKLIYREAELIDGALEHRCQGETLLHLDVPLAPVTPSDLVRQGLQYQAIHFAGPTSQPARSQDLQGEFWMNRLVEETAQQENHELEDALGMEGEVLGVDPVTSLLDDIVQRYEQAESHLDMVHAEAALVGGDGFFVPSVPSVSTRSWLLADGPVHPENLERGGTLPPFIFSNSYQALPSLGHRFVKAGASTFVGPVVPLFSRPARIFAGHYYRAMGQGWCAGAALWKASRECRRELGDTHPAWLSYGILGYGQLALQYL
jgi:hypothetical protein